MKRSEYQDRLRHDDFLRRWADLIADDDEPLWLRRVMLGILLAAVLVMVLYVAQATVLR